MPVLALVKGLKWYEWLFIGALLVFFALTYIQYQQLQAAKRELTTIRFSLEAMTQEHNRLVFTRELDERIQQALSGETANFLEVYIQEDAQFREAYKALVAQHEATQLPVPEDYSPPATPTLSVNVEVGADTAETTPPPVRTTTPDTTPPPPFAKPQPPKKDTAHAPPPRVDTVQPRIRLISQRLHRAHACSKDPLSCTS